MKISKKINNKFIRRFFVIICCYLAASAGVNGVISPSYYFTESQEHFLDYYERNECLYIDVSALAEKDYFINICLSNIQRFGSVIYLYSDIDKNEKLYTLLSGGSNSIKISELPLNEGTIYIRLNDLYKDGVEISRITASEKKLVDTYSMLKIFLSAILLVVFVEFINILKKRYTM